ncbi:ubiquitin-conjugating enzyme E2 T-like [Oscarella lobularis]|uniref:ubiquitin-conjugating enzyme E2 T-like n=1 Tax=Oscarella lobularis TaxID=121494 RepID=UPI0033133564
MQCHTRLKRELKSLSESPPPNVSCWLNEDSLNTLTAKIIGPPSTPYEKGVFTLHIAIPDRYPFEPPRIRFTTPIYHPNIDDAGRICLDLLKMPPNGAWKPAVNIAGLLSSIFLLMSDPNPDDGLMFDIARQYKTDKGAFTRKAREWTQRHAMKETSDDEPQSKCPRLD